MNWDKFFENLWQLLLIGAVASFLVLLTLYFFTDKKVVHYSLSTTDSGVPAIVREIDWAPDDVNYLKEGTTYEEAFKLMSDLNKELKNSK